MKIKPLAGGLLLLTLFVHGLANNAYAAQSESIRYVAAEKERWASKAVIVDDVPLAHTAQFLPFSEKGEIVGKGNVAQQTKQSIENLKRALVLAGTDWTHVVKINVYVSRDENVESVAKVLAQTFSGKAKPSVTFVTGNLTTPDALVAMDAVAVVKTEKPQSSSQRMAMQQGFKDKTAAVAILPSGGKFYISGQAKNGDITEATRGTLASLEETLKFLGLSKTHVVQLKAFMQPISDKEIVEAEVAKFFEGELAPPVVYVEWSSPTNTPIEIEMIASEGKSEESRGDSVVFSTPPKLTTSKVFSRVAHVRNGKSIYLSGLYGKQSTSGAEQVREIFDELKTIANETGSDLEHLVKATYYVSDSEASAKLNDIRPEFYNPLRPPAASKAMVKGVGSTGNTITVDMIAVAK
ncbi:RidA family protein [Pedosphaera parvula]|uniref:Endoribonuclease L-PSP n=1 Tax=Pedosphaera parvula (strain Ellin514) TaxID=320771 RepID=B9XE23_PEDPL|nr:Rid family hydrolase [Pedosphaera parvula]EEF61914.1 Endoribonuclease L-PSP [Pedosphaera parvula Ellin514]